MMEENKCRAFVGAPIPASLYERLKKLAKPDQDAFSNGHWILPENAHITIRFFGDIDRNKLSKLWDEIQHKIKNEIHPFLVRVDNIGLFPHQNSNLIAAYIKENNKIQRLFSLINEIQINSVSADKKAFIPHITLFRGNDDIAMQLSPISVQHININIDTLILYESVLINEKRFYQRLYSTRL